GPQNDVTLKMPAFEWVHVQLHQQKGMISLSPPTICNSASTGDGLCLLTKRLERGRFAWPSARDGKVFLTPAQLAMLLEGIDWRQPKRLLTSLTML
ncbi:IS66 family insertion sequence element accessory protein TnpB, partial [Escherichia coli]|uniref:IS66 family insertion sequence element accessory protein TnpB n=1 Tax=Escherichia coli TaxID=562 RepID=UPI002F26C88E